MPRVIRSAKSVVSIYFFVIPTKQVNILNNFSPLSENSMDLPDTTYTLSELQAYQAAICKKRGWDKTSDLETFLLFSEEIGELAKAIRKRRNLYTELGKSSEKDGIEGEFADVLSYLMELANRFEVDLAKAYRNKEAINADREWK